MQEVTEEDIAQAYVDMAQSKSGQIVLADMERRFGYTRRTMLDGDDTTGLRLAWREGGRAVLAHISRMIESSINNTEVET